MESGDKKKSNRTRTIVIVVAIILVIGVVGNLFGNSDSEEEEETLPEATEEESKEEVEEAEVESEKDTDADDQWDAGDLAYLGMSRDQIMEIYNYYMELIDDPSANDLSSEEVRQYEDECKEKTAEEFGITTEDVDNIFFASLDADFFSTFDMSSVKMKYGELKDIVVTENGPLVSAKITSSSSNQNAIDQCYYDACDFIRNYAGTDYDEVTFAGYADFQDGTEKKFIQFTIPENVIKTIATGDFADNTLGDYVNDLWIIESMR